MCFIKDGFRLVYANSHYLRTGRSWHFLKVGKKPIALRYAFKSERGEASVIIESNALQEPIKITPGEKTLYLFERGTYLIKAKTKRHHGSFSFWKKKISPILIETKRLTIRLYKKEDIEDLKAIIGDAETMAFYPKPYDEQGVRKWMDWSLDSYRDNGFGLFAICLKGSDKMIGDSGITMQNIDGEILPELGFHLNKAYWRQGFAKEAALAVLNWAFSNTDFETIYSYTQKDNVPSIKTAASVGMHIVKEFKNDAGETDVVSAISKSEFLIR